MTLLARIISYLLHPLLMPAFGILVIFNTGTYLSFLPFEYQRMLYILVFLTTFVLPMIIIPVFLYWKVIKTMEMHNRNERFFPMLVTLVFNIATYYLFYRLPLPAPIRYYMLAVTICVFLTMIITIRWKISSHMVGTGGITGLIAALAFLFIGELQVYLMASIFLAGVTGFARLKLNAHSPVQVYAGFLLGFLVEFLTIVLLTGRSPVH